MTGAYSLSSVVIFKMPTWFCRHMYLDEVVLIYNSMLILM